MDAGDWALITATFVQTLGILPLRRADPASWGPVFFSTVNFIVALAGIGWGFLFFGETHSHWVWLALVCLMLGVIFVIQRRPEPTRSGG